MKEKDIKQFILNTTVLQLHQQQVFILQKNY